MKRIYSHPDVAIVHLVKNELKNQGIDAVIRGQHVAALLGVGAGVDAWNELWVTDEEHLEEAEAVVRRVVAQTDVPEGAPWACPHCGELIEAPFDVCWNCGEERPEY